MTRLWNTIGAVLLLTCAVLAAGRLEGGGTAPPAMPREIDTSSLRHKVLCGYQGWFRCPGDPADEGWRHWSRDPDRITPGTLTFEMWPDLSEYTADEKYSAPGFTHPDGGQAHLFSSAHPLTVRRHFDWMEHHGIDGVFLQRFLVALDRPSLDLVLGHVRVAAEETGRVYAICYDMSGHPEHRLYETLVNDWKRLVDELGVTRDDRYLHHDGKPVLFVWGFYPDRFGAATAHTIIDFFEEDGPYKVTLIGGVPWYWRDEGDADWAKAFRRFDVISPWNVGNYFEDAGRRYASTGSWAGDLAEARRVGMNFLPVLYPGFGWTNLKGEDAADATIPRLGGGFYWRQFATASDLGVEMAYVAMFDEVDEATAIFKVTNDPPEQADFATFEGLPPDWYLRLTGEGSKVIRGEREGRIALPIQP